MGLIFENLIRRFNELANETAGDHFTPRDVIRLMVSILFMEDNELLATPGTVRKEAARPRLRHGRHAGGGAELSARPPSARLGSIVYGQDYNKRAFATAASDMLMKQVDHNGTGNNVQFGDSLIDDKFAGRDLSITFLTNPPFGVDWKRQQHGDQAGTRKTRLRRPLRCWPAACERWFAAFFATHVATSGNPCEPAEHKHGSRLAIVFSGSPLFTGGAGSGESNIRRVADRERLAGGHYRTA